MRQVSLGPLPPRRRHRTDARLAHPRGARVRERQHRSPHRGRGQLRRQFYFHHHQAIECHGADGREPRCSPRQLLCRLAQAQRQEKHVRAPGFLVANTPKADSLCSLRVFRVLAQTRRYPYFERWISRMSKMGHSGAVVPVHWATVFASNRSSLRRSLILARMSSR